MRRHIELLARLLALARHSPPLSSPSQLHDVARLITGGGDEILLTTVKLYSPARLRSPRRMRHVSTADRVVPAGEPSQVRMLRAFSGNLDGTPFLLVGADQGHTWCTPTPCAFH